MADIEIQPELLSMIRRHMVSLHIVSGHETVYKDECIFSFQSPFTEGGLYVNLASLHGLGMDYLENDIKKGGRIYLHEVWNQIPIENAQTPSTIEKIAIGVEGGFSDVAKFDIVKSEYLVVVGDNGELHSIPLPNKFLPEFLCNVIQSVINHGGMKVLMQQESWELTEDRPVSKYAINLVQLDNGKRISQDPTQWRCELTGATENLWLNLSTGYIGGGRKNWDGSGGSGGALKHFNDTGNLYPLCVKLGTITAKGADVWSYAPDEDTLVQDPLLAQHLSNWGIDIMRLEKTDKSMSELEVSLNAQYDWSRILDEKEEVTSLRGAGPGYVGLHNIGSSCYMNSVLQVLASIPEIRERYLYSRDRILSTSANDPAADFSVQFSKVLEALYTKKFLPPSVESDSLLEKYVIAPRVFKQLVGRGHPEFSSMRQQDASEYFMHLLEYMKRAERTSLSRIFGGDSGNVSSTSALFEYRLESRIQCKTTGKVKYVSDNSCLGNTLELRIPLDEAVNKEEYERAKAATRDPKKQRLDAVAVAAVDSLGAAGVPVDESKEDVKLLVPFQAALATVFGDEEIDFKNSDPDLGPGGRMVKASRHVRIKKFPKYLTVKLGRYYVGDNWVQVKVDARVPVPMHLDLSAYRGGLGLQPGEVAMATTEENLSAVGSTEATPVATMNEDFVSQLMSMGFSENGSRRAVMATQSVDAETAMNWVFEHMEDPDFNEPIAAVNVPTANALNTVESQEAVDLIVSMGYTQAQAKIALRATDNNLERAMDWIFSHADDSAVAMDIVPPMQAAGLSTESSNLRPTGNNEADISDSSGQYTLLALISHIGKSLDHGHYVCHVFKEGRWVLYNDEKVAEVRSVPLDHGFMYFFRRND